MEEDPEVGQERGIPASGETRPRRDGPGRPRPRSRRQSGQLEPLREFAEALAASRRRRRLSKMSMGPETTGETGHKGNPLGIGLDSFR